MRVLYLTHPQVQIDPNVPVPDWGLSEYGRERAALAAGSAWTRAIRAIVASGERKAVETANIVGAAYGLVPRIRHDMHENDRSATGFLPPRAFEAMADAFFANPSTSIRGWERAIDAQNRIVAAAEAEIIGAGAGDLLFVGHGGVGTLLLCHWLGVAIGREHDQRPGGGCVFAFDAATRRVIHPWLALEDARVGV